MSQATAKSYVTKSYVVRRDTKTGRFVSKSVASRRPATTKVEKIVVKGKVSPKSAKVIGKANVKYHKALVKLAKR